MAGKINWEKTNKNKLVFKNGIDFLNITEMSNKKEYVINQTIKERKLTKSKWDAAIPRKIKSLENSTKQIEASINKKKRQIDQLEQEWSKK